MLGNLPWKVCVFTDGDVPDKYRDIKNSLLYADHVYWISVEAFMAAEKYYSDNLQAWRLEADKHRPEYKQLFKFQSPKGYLRLMSELRISGAMALVSPQLGSTEALQVLGKFMRKGVQTREKAASTRTAEVDRLARYLDDLLRKAVSPALTDSRAIVGDNVLFSQPRGGIWNTPQAAHQLMMSLSRLLLPDVSNLPLEGILELRYQLRDSLDPVRAALLRLTEDLRSIVSSSQDPELISAEADNLIATRVEPLVRDANRRAKELLDQKWRKLLTEVTKAFGFTGAGFVNPKLFEKAIEQSIKAGALALTPVEEDRADSLKVTSQFVLNARSLISEAGPPE